MKQRHTTVTRRTAETDINIELNLDGSGKSKISTGIPFLNHMFELFAKHGFFDLKIDAVGDIEIDYHHTMEDLGLTLGQAIREAVGDKAGMRRYGSCLLPMDETLVQIALDISGRPFLVYDLVPPVERIKDIDTALFHEFFQALTVQTGMNLHITLIRGSEIHHIFEAVFKALAKALDMAVAIEPRLNGVMSTKGSL